MSIFAKRKSAEQKESGKSRDACAKRRGIALLIVLMVTTILTVVVLDFAQSTRINFYIAANIQNGMKAYYMAKSGVQVAEGSLLRDGQKNKDDHLDEDWNNPLFSYIPLSETETISVNITDESSKFNVNRMVGGTGSVRQSEVEIFRKLLELLQLDPTIADAAADWLDSDDEAYNGAGTENQFYGYSASPGGAYKAKNGQLSSLAEMKLIQGVNDDVFKKLAEVCTIYSDAKLNINTIQEKVLNAIILSIDEKADAGKIISSITAYRDTPDQYFESKTLRAQLMEAGVEPRMAARLRQKLNTVSRYFSVDVTANVGPTVKSVRGVVKRSKKKVSLIYFRPGELLNPPKTMDDLGAMGDMLQAAQDSGLNFSDFMQ